MSVSGTGCSGQVSTLPPSPGSLLHCRQGMSRPIRLGSFWKLKKLNIARVSFQVSLLVVVEIGVFPLICGWWLDICSLVRRFPFSLLDSAIRSSLFFDTLNFYYRLDKNPHLSRAARMFAPSKCWVAVAHLLQIFMSRHFSTWTFPAAGKTSASSYTLPNLAC